MGVMDALLIVHSERQQIVNMSAAYVMSLRFIAFGRGRTNWREAYDGYAARVPVNRLCITRWDYRKTTIPGVV